MGLGQRGLCARRRQQRRVRQRADVQRRRRARRRSRSDAARRRRPLQTPQTSGRAAVSPSRRWTSQCALRSSSTWLIAQVNNNCDEVIPSFSASTVRTAEHGAIQSGRPAAPAAHRHHRSARGVGARGCARCGLDLDLGPLLPAQRRPGGHPLRGLQPAGRDGRDDRPGPLRHARVLQQLPQSRAAGGHGAHRQPALRRTPRAGHRRRVVRARLHRVRLRVRHRAGAAAGAQGARCRASRSAWASSSPPTPTCRSSSAAAGRR